MNSDLAQLLGLAVLLLAEQYMIAPWQFPVIARMWDSVARICGIISDILGYAALRARANYFTAVQYGN